LNSPEQTVIAGSQAAVKEAVKKLKGLGIQAQIIPVACAFHSSLVASACKNMEKYLSRLQIGSPCIQVFTNTTASTYTAGSQEITSRLLQHLVSRVDFIREIEAMYAAGARIFIEAGPGKILTGFVKQILADKPHLAVISNQAERPGITQLQHMLGELAAHGIPVVPRALYDGRPLQKIDLKTFRPADKPAPRSSTSWLVNGTRALAPGESITAPSRPSGALFQLQASQESSSPETKHGDALGSSGWTGTGRVSLDAIAARKEKASPAMSPGAGYDHTLVMDGFQKMMHRFLETQKHIMLSYLTGASGRGNQPAEYPGEKVMKKEEREPAEQQAARQAPQVPERKAPQKSPGPEAAPAGDPSPPASSTALSDEKELLAQLLEIVSERTGYPADMINLDLNLEADLGIDSIKRVEILGAFIKKCAGAHNEILEKGMENLTGIKTLRGILTRIQEQAGSVSEGRAAESRSEGTVEEQEPDAARGGAETIQRFTLSPVPASGMLPYAPLRVSGVIVVTDDERGVAQNLSVELKNLGHSVALVRLTDETKELSSGCYSTTFTTPEDVARLLEIIRDRQGSVGGLIHLLPLKKFSPYHAIDFAGLKERFQFEVKSLFSLIKNIEKDLRQFKEKGQASCIIAATGMGGSFASDPSVLHQQFFPGQGGIAGLLKTVALEWPDVRVKAIDFSPEESAAGLADHIMRELNSSDTTVEIGYAGEQRLVLMPTLTPLKKDGPDRLNIDASWVILATGGARGITAEIACELARNYKPTLILAGRSALPPETEAPDTAGLTSEREMKAALIAQSKQQGKIPALAEIDTQYRTLCKEREIRLNLAAMREAGATVKYFQVDVRDEQAFSSLIDFVYESYGKIDGVIHGAGIILDKLIADKTPESFDQVFGTKTESAFILSRMLRPESLKFFVLFSSVAGLFGNQGQCDYAAANEVLNKLTPYLNT
ncbi:MAG: SDR family NAD(P)-dependent oxidoreductase, partial [Pseudomonadota bacterium]